MFIIKSTTNQIMSMDNNGQVNLSDCDANGKLTVLTFYDKDEAIAYAKEFETENHFETGFLRVFQVGLEEVISEEEEAEYLKKVHELINAKGSPPILMGYVSNDIPCVQMIARNFVGHNIKFQRIYGASDGLFIGENGISYKYFVPIHPSSLFFASTKLPEKVSFGTNENSDKAVMANSINSQ